MAATLDLFRRQPNANTKLDLRSAIVDRDYRHDFRTPPKNFREAFKLCGQIVSFEKNVAISTDRKDVTRQLPFLHIDR